MSMRIVCPEGHLVVVAANKRGRTVVCPRCLTSFPAHLDIFPTCHARKDEGKSSKSRDDDSDEEIEVRIEEDKPQKKAGAKKTKKDEDADEEIEVRIEEDKPQKKVGVKKAKQDDDADEKIDGRIQEGTPDKKASAKKAAKADEEDEKPRNKKSAGKKSDDEDEEDEKPRARRRSRKEEDDEDDEDDEEKGADEPFEDEENRIDWTPRKRQLSMVNKALIFYQITFWAMFALYILDIIFGVIQVLAAFIPGLQFLVAILFLFILAPAALLTYIALLVAWIMCFWAPKKAELFAPIIVAIIFLMVPVLFLLTFLILALTGVFRNDDITARFGELILTGCGISMLISFFYGLEILRRLAAFMKDSGLVNQPITLGWFIVGGTFLRFICAIAYLFMLKMYAGLPLDFFTAALLGIPIYFGWASFFFVLRSILELIKVVTKLRVGIEKYIMDR